MRPSVGNLVGYVKVQVGSKEVALPVEEVSVENETTGFVMEGANFGILVHPTVRPEDFEKQVSGAVEEAVRRLSRKMLN